MSQDNVEIENEESFAEKCQQILNDSSAGILMCVGWRLGLFDSLGSFDHPVTSLELAEKCQMKERYIREWLNGCVSFGLVDAEDCSSILRYSLLKSRLEVLSSHSKLPYLSMVSLLPMMAEPYAELLNCFKPEGPTGIPYESYSKFHEVMSKRSQSSRSRDILLSLIIPSVPENFENRLKNDGLICVDVGCSLGTTVKWLAEAFPKSQFIGFDIDPGAIEEAKIDSLGEKKNFEFQVENCQRLPENWTEKFDLAFAFDSIHDQSRPDLALKEIYRILKPGGALAMFEPNFESNPYKNLKNPLANLGYVFSLFHCLPVALVEKNAIGLGTCWGREKIMEFLKNAGFRSVEIVEIPKGAFNAQFYAKK